MTIRTPVVSGGAFHEPIGPTDVLDPASVAVSADAGNHLARHADGLFVPPVNAADIPLSAQSGNVIVAKPDGLYANPAAPVLPYYRWEMGHSGQPNGGRGIDEGTWWRLDMRVGGSGTLPVTFDTDGYVILPAGDYLVFSGATVSVTAATGEWKASVAEHGPYGYPGVYQNSTQFYKKLDGTAQRFSLSLSGISLPYTTAFIGFDKGSDGSAVAQGFVGFLKVS
ncbi:hypothetical protein [Burkholderia cenocepacia]|uniref:hypothetical protein n=1 Tax=Burkholderia cenocepacia TaxID=95486 RepID=UPI002B242703|nr:hypothetical protein [Burkholderia cenocepacia]MEB2499543.1 hypothetical protein [Burkholderia cenocepacia]MEB2557218.1 hypothetical protein [Burkholderia cenocepacia]